MRHYAKITVRENHKRLDKLFEFRNLVIEYFNNSTKSGRGLRAEKEIAQVARVKINRIMKENHEIILHSGMDPIMIYKAPPMVGGHTRNIDVILNIFNLDRFDIPANQVLDLIDMTIGVYESDHRRAVVRTFNPLFYLMLALDTISELPFSIIGKFGFNQQKAESSIIGRLFKGFLYLVTPVAGFLTILHLLDLLEPVKELARELLVLR